MNKNFTEQELDYINGKSVPYEYETANIRVVSNAKYGSPYYDVYANMIANEEYVFKFSTPVKAEEVLNGISFATRGVALIREFSKLTAVTTLDNQVLIIPNLSWEEAKGYTKLLREQEVEITNKLEQADTLKR